MANIKVSELTEATVFDDEDYTMIVQANQNKKISRENILGNIETNISTINNNIGNLSNLATEDKTSIVNSINELERLGTKSIATYSCDDTANVSAGGTIPLNTTDVSVGSKFTLSSNKIVIGAGVTKVKVSAQIWYSKENTTRQWFYLTKNNSYVNQIIVYGGNYECVNFSPKLISVEEGDTIGLQLFTIEGTGNITINSGSGIKNCTFITIEEI